jgi:DNA-binding NtrC family response regulator/tetratricopeptide (TPR) repeat protein
MADTATVEHRLKQGLFYAAAEGLTPFDVRETRDSWRLALASEAFERTGRTAEALAAVREICRREAAPSRPLARALVVRGVIEHERNPEASVSTLEQAAQAAADAGAAGELCWSRLRLLPSRFELNPNFDVDAAVADARSAVDRHVDPAATIAFHVFASEVYAKRGALPPARRHLGTAQDLLKRLENPWLGGLVAIAGFCIAYLEMDYAAAEHAAKQALRFSRTSGHLRSEFAAITNLGHVWIHFGRLEEAGRLLRRASAMCDLSSHLRDSVRDGLAQLEARRGNLGSSRHLVDEVLASRSPRHAYPRVWGALTKAEMLLRQGLHQECRAVCEAALAALPSPTDRGLALRLRLTRSEVLARTGAFHEAGRVAARARQDAVGSPPGLLAELNHRIANVLSLSGLDLQAEALEDRAQRLNVPPGRRAPAPGPRRAVPADRGGEPHRAGDVPARVLDRTAAIFEQAGRPELAAAEMGRLLDDLGCCTRWVVVRETGGSRFVVESSQPMSTGELRDVLHDPRVFTLDLFERAGQKFAVLAEPKASIAATESLSTVVRLARHCQALADSERAPEASAGGEWPDDLSGLSGALHIARRVADTDVPVLLLGETGVGKEWLARRIHEWSGRAGSRFVGFNCAAVSRDLIEAQLFGHRRGAFTGAVDGSRGVLRAAEGGTVLLDEIAEVPTDCQPKLLRFLETGEVHGVGESVPQPANVRVLAATNRRLDELTAGTIMRSDLFYRLNVVRIEIPPLRQRRSEILPLALEALQRFGTEFRKGHLRFSDATRQVLAGYDWPGNVRQLVNELRRAAVLAGPGQVIEPADLSPEVGGSTPPPASARSQVTIALDQSLADATESLERASILRALELCQGHRDQAAALLGLSRKGLYLKCQRLNIDVPESSGPPDAVSS